MENVSVLGNVYVCMNTRSLVSLFMYNITYAVIWLTRGDIHVKYPEITPFDWISCN